MPSVLVTRAILMPTYEAEPAFFRDLDHLTNQERNAFFAAVRKFVAGLNEGDLRAGLRVKTDARVHDQLIDHDAPAASPRRHRLERLHDISGSAASSMIFTK